MAQIQTFKNPILGGFHPDPSCVCVDGVFYLVNSTFQWFPRIAVHVSQDLVHWTPCKSAISEPGLISVDEAITRHERTEGVLAPTIRYHKGTFFIICTNVLLLGKAETFIVTSTDPISGKWSKPIHIDFHGIDPSLFFDTDDKVYFQGTMLPAMPADGQLPEGVLPQIVQMEIDPFTGKSLSGPPKPLLKAFGGGWAEGPHVYKKDGWYYGLLAEDGTEINHCVTICRSRSVWGPFENHPKNPVLTGRGTDDYIQALGHADLFQDPHGNWWAVALGVRLAGECFPLERETFLCPVTWRENEWPIFNDWNPVKADMTSKQPLPTPPKIHPAIKPAFAKVKLDPECLLLVYLRDPDFSSYKWLAGGRLEITGKAANLHQPTGTASLVGFRQTSLACEVAVTLDFQPSENDEAGLSVYVDQFRHLDISVRQGAGGAGRKIVFAVSCLKAETSVQDIPIGNSGPVRLRVRCSETEYKFDASAVAGDEVGNWKEVGTVSSALISEWGFTGPMFTMFATSNGKGETAPAIFTNLLVNDDVA